VSSWLKSFGRVCFLSCLLAGALAVVAQEPAAKPENSPPPNEKAGTPQAEEKATLPFQIELLETHIRFEANGDSRKEVHTIVKINDAAGARQFARLGFDYNRGFQAVEIPLAKITHANGGTSEILPSAVVDAPTPAVETFPAYQDVRVKSVRILGLRDGDTLEYRVTTNTTNPPLAPDFWLEHTFDRSGQVENEEYELDLPKPPRLTIRINPETPAARAEPAGDGSAPRTIYRWKRLARTSGARNPDSDAKPDISVSTYDWDYLGMRLAEALIPGAKPFREAKTPEESNKELSRQPEVTRVIEEKAASLTQGSKSDLERLKAIYDFVSTQIKTVDLLPGATGFRVRTAESILQSGYATGEDKYVLLAALGAAFHIPTQAILVGFCDQGAVPDPMLFKHLLVEAHVDRQSYWMDPVLEVAPFGMISPTPCKTGLLLNLGFASLDSSGHQWGALPSTLPFAAFQKVNVEASLSAEGTLRARLQYITRGNNELVLRMAFHQTPKQRWNEVAGLLALADGFRGEITKVTASDPMETKDPFTVEYEISQSRFVDWSRKPMRIPALLPQIALPDAPAKSETGAIELGTPLEVETRLTLKLPEGTQVETPPGTSVARDYATYASNYDGHLNTLTAARHVHFLMKEIAAGRSADYGAFVRAVQLDQAQLIALFPEEKKEKK
jgi:hypothetical protein